MILVIAIEESINWLIKAISHYIIEFWFITISTLQDCPREQSHFWTLFITKRRTIYSFSTQTCLEKGEVVWWDFPQLLMKINNGMSSRWQRKRQTVFSDSAKDKWRKEVMNTGVQSPWGLGCPGLWDSRLHSGIHSSQSITLDLNMLVLIKYAFKLDERTESF